MFDRASEILKSGLAERAVCLMDIPDEFDQQNNVALYIRTFERAIFFQKEYRDTLWCWGNHDLSYPWLRYESGYSLAAAKTVREELEELRTLMPDEHSLAYIHRIDDVLFMHGGLSENFVRKISRNVHYNAAHGDYNDAVIETVNSLDDSIMWDEDSPLWLRPQLTKCRMYMAETMLQVVGHTPVREITRTGNVLSCDVFSCDRKGRPIGSMEFLLLDTKSWEYRGISARAAD